MIKGIYGVNIAVKDLNEAIKRYESVFGVKSEPMGARDFAFPGLIVAKLNIGGTYITLVSSIAENTSVANFLAKKGEGVFLLSVRVDDMEKDVASLKEKGLIFALKDVASGDFGKVTFVHPKSMNGVQIEVYQPSKD
jgi:methylmalonyl-CoA/ethylmalonyl-CoA epimerase